LSFIGEVSIATQLNSMSSGVELCRYRHPFNASAEMNPSHKISIK